VLTPHHGPERQDHAADLGRRERLTEGGPPDHGRDQWREQPEQWDPGGWEPLQTPEPDRVRHGGAHHRQV